MAERNGVLDVARGVCALSVIFIHTVFWSGEHYVPPLVRGLSLFLDVPAFFFLSGCSRSLAGRETCIQGILRIILAFSVFSVLHAFISLDFSIDNLFRVMTLNTPDYKYLPVVGGSFWFVPVFCVVGIWTAAILSFSKTTRALQMWIGAIGLFYVSRFFGAAPVKMGFLGVDLEQVLFYTALYLGGFLFAQMNFVDQQSRRWGISIAIGALVLFGCLSFFVQDVSIQNLQRFKFPASLPYQLVSMVSIGMIIFFWKARIRAPSLSHVGKNALYYYVAQGVGGSALIFVTNYFLAPWPAKLPLMFLLNLSITIPVAEGLRVVTKSFERAVARP